MQLFWQDMHSIHMKPHALAALARALSTPTPQVTHSHNAGNYLPRRCQRASSAQALKRLHAQITWSAALLLAQQRQVQDLSRCVHL